MHGNCKPCHFVVVFLIFVWLLSLHFVVHPGILLTIRTRTRGLCAHVACAHTWPVRTRGLCAHVACAHTWPVRTRGLCAHVACAHTWPVRTRGLCAHVACAHTWPVRMLTFNIDKNTLYTWQFKGPSITYVTHGGGGCASQTWGVLVSVTERNMGTWGCLGDPY